MIFIYQQANGLFWAPSGKLLGKGYSGAPEGKNDYEKEHIKNVGPIPIGLWTIDGHYESGTLGPNVIVLNPHRHEAHGRTAFRIHGDSKKNPGDASQGCIVLPPDIRQLIIDGFTLERSNTFLMVVQ